MHAHKQLRRYYTQTQTSSSINNKHKTTNKFTTEQFFDPSIMPTEIAGIKFKKKLYSGNKNI